MLPRTLTFVDVETTGASLRNSRIIEIGIIRVENDQVVDTFHSLLDPETHIPPEILEFTGITQDEIKNAPTFSQIKDTVMELFNDSVFVAHNVKFDYSFIKKEFVMLEEQFNAKTMFPVRKDDEPANDDLPAILRKEVKVLKPIQFKKGAGPKAP